MTAIALYGVKDEAYASYWESAEAAVSEIIPILEHEEYGKHVLLGATPFPLLWGWQLTFCLRRTYETSKRAGRRANPSDLYRSGGRNRTSI